MTELPAPSADGFGPAALGTRDRVTYAELRQVDRTCGDLFLWGHELLGREDAAAVLLLAHAGRELSRGIVRALTGSEMLVSETGDVSDTEKNRATISAALQQHPKAPAVTLWFTLNKIFADSCHYFDRPIDAKVIRDSFRRFADLLYGRVAPHFDTQEALSALLAVENPTAEQIERAATLLTRPQQRRYFFTSLQHVGWLVPLVDRGYFATPPDRIFNADGTWQSQAWPEGQYLVRIAGEAPDLVTAELLSVPTELANPSVWATIVLAARRMPSNNSAKLAKRIAAALHAVPTVYWSHEIVELAAELAAHGEVDAAFQLANALLWMPADPPPAPEGIASALGFRSAQPLPRLPQYELSRFVSLVMPALERADPERTVMFLADRLSKAVSMEEPQTNTVARSSTGWCDRLDHVHDSSDPREVIAVAFARVARTHAARGREEAQTVWARLVKESSDVFERVRWLVLQDAGHLLQEQLDGAVGGGVLVEPPYGARECAALLRARFKDARPLARALFCYALERGPSLRESLLSVDPPEAGDEQIEQSGTDIEENDVAETGLAAAESAIAEAVREWQARRLRWFRGDIPSELHGLAARIGVTNVVPDFRQQELDEVGHYSSGVVSRGVAASPKSAAALQSMTPDAFFEFLLEWNPPADEWGDRGFEGMEAAVTEFAHGDASAAVVLLGDDRLSAVRARYTVALLDGIRDAVDGGAEVVWPSLLGSAPSLIVRAESLLLEPPAESDPESPWDENVFDTESSDAIGIVRSLARLATHGCRDDRVPSDAAGSLSSLIEALVRSPVTWLQTRRVTDRIADLERAVMASLNTAGGDVAELVITYGLWARRNTGDEGTPEGVDRLARLESQLAGLCSVLLKQGGESSLGALAMLGRELPWLIDLVPNWFQENESELLAGRAEHSASNPVWGAYITSHRFFDVTFRRLRSWYREAAESALRDVPGSGGAKDRYSVTAGLMSHALTAVVRGVATVRDDDGLISAVFAGASAAEKAHTYWEIFRGWSDSKSVPSVDVVERVLDVWRWRLDVLEPLAPSQERSEELEGLLWFFQTPHLPDKEVIQLTARTLRLGAPSKRSAFGAWERLTALAGVDTSGTCDLVELFVDEILSSEHPYISEGEASRTLHTLLRSADPEVVGRTKRIVHRFGEAGFLGFGALLRELPGADGTVQND